MIMHIRIIYMLCLQAVYIYFFSFRMIGYLAAFQVILITECNAFLGQGIIGGGRGTGERMGKFFLKFTHRKRILKLVLIMFRH